MLPSGSQLSSASCYNNLHLLYYTVRLHPNQHIYALTGKKGLQTEEDDEERQVEEASHFVSVI